MRNVSAKALLSLVALASLAGTASAWLTASGSGNGSGSSSVTTQDVTLSAAAPSARLYPGSSSAVAATISNPNASPARVRSLVLDTSQSGGFDVDPAHAGCDADAVLTFTAQNAGWTVPANGSAPVTLADAVTLARSAPNACQGATFTVYLKAGV